MSKLYISEFTHLAKDSTGATIPVPLAVGDGFSQVVSIGPASIKSAILNASTTFIRIVSDVNCSVAYGKDPKASPSSFRLIANRPELFGIQAGTGMKLAVISGSGVGTVEESEVKPTVPTPASAPKPANPIK